MDEWIGEESVILCMNYELSWVEVSLSLPVQGWGTLGCTPDSQSIRLGQAEAKVGGKAKEERPCHFSPVQPSPVPLPLPGLGFCGRQQHYGINHHHRPHCLVLSSPSPLFQGFSKAD